MLHTITHYIKANHLTRGIYSRISNFMREEVSLVNPFGTNIGKSVYIIRRYDSAGFFSNFMFVLGHIILAEKHNYIPVVDMEHYPTPYNEKKAINGTRNAWEYYFHQPTELSLHKAYLTRKIILSSGKMPFDEVPYYGLHNSKFPGPQLVDQLKPYIQKYVSFKPELVQEAEGIILDWERNVLGVHIRGTDMKCTPGHPVPPSVEEYIDAIEKAYKEYKYIFICTDEVSLLEKMREQFGKRVVFTNAYRSDDGTSIHGSKNKTVRTAHNYLNGREVVMDALILSRCNAIICGHSNVSYAAILLNENKYDFVQLLESHPPV